MILSTKSLIGIGALIAGLLGVAGTVLVTRETPKQIIVVKIPPPAAPPSTITPRWTKQQDEFIKQNLGFAPGSNRRDAKGNLIP